MSICAAAKVFIGHGNILTLEPYAYDTTGERLDMSGATRVDVCVGGASASSDTLGTAIWWEITEDQEWVIQLKLGLVPDIQQGEQPLRVIVYDGEYTEGLVLTHDYPLLVIGGC